MADPITIIGAVGTIAALIELTAKTIRGIQDLRSEYKAYEVTLLNLTVQLTTLNAALKRIDGWVAEAESAGVHHQLIMDLDLSMSCISSLIEKTWEQVVSLRGVGRSAKATFLFKGKSIEQLQSGIAHQTAALNLLLTACNFTSITDQKTFLEKPKARKVIKKVQDDSISLLCLRDESSFTTGITDNLSKLSMVFAFDQELFGSKVYMRQLRSSVKDRLRLRKSNEPSFSRIGTSNGVFTGPTDKYETISSSDEATKPKDEVEILILGIGESGKSTVLKQFRFAYLEGEPREEEREFYRGYIFSSLIENLQDILNQEDYKITFELPENELYAKQIQGHSGDFPLHAPLPQELRPAFQALWKDKGVQKAGGEIAKNFPDLQLALGLYFEKLDVLFDPDYRPTIQDILRFYGRTIGVEETSFSIGPQECAVYTFSGIRTQRRKWVHFFPDPSAVIFVVAISEYDAVLFENHEINRMAESLKLFESLVNSEWFLHAPVFLLFNKVDHLQQKLSETPLQGFFPDFEGGDDYNAACEYISSKFLSLNKTDKHVHVYFTNATDTLQMRSVLQEINKIAIATRDLMIGIQH